MDYLKRACEVLDVSPAKVLSHRVTDDSIVVIVDNGIYGAPKHEVPLSQLQAAPQATEPASIDLAGLKVTELRKLAKAQGINISGLKKSELIAALGG